MLDESDALIEALRLVLKLVLAESEALIEALRLVLNELEADSLVETD